jgi:peptidoglycan LD-endopeptidase LytH
MTSPRNARVHERMLAMLAIGFCLGALATTYLGWRRDALLAMQSGSATADSPALQRDRTANRTGPNLSDALEPRTAGDVVRNAPAVGPSDVPVTASFAADLELLRRKDLRIPIDGVAHAALQQSFDEPRGSSRHEAIDILAPRHTPVHAVEDGVVAKLFRSERGGITVYQYDPTGAFCYYYAHLDRYAEGLKEGQSLRQGDLVGYVGTSGNAPEGTPHLHFAIFRLQQAGRWWEGTPIDPYEALR